MIFRIQVLAECYFIATGPPGIAHLVHQHQVTEADNDVVTLSLDVKDLLNVVVHHLQFTIDRLKAVELYPFLEDVLLVGLGQ